MKIQLPSGVADYDPATQPNTVSRLRLMDPFLVKGGFYLWLPWMPEEISTSNEAQVWEQLARPGQTPLLRQTGRNLPTLSFTARLVYPGQDVPVENELASLRALAGSSTPVRVDLAGRYRGMFRITGMAVRETMWLRSGEACDAEVNLELTAASDVVVAVGPIKKKHKKQKKGGAKHRKKKQKKGAT